ncbi:MAG: glycosyltransferase family 2 protein [Cyanobacteriota bacterium]|nr:glycosyltransferase family 2 protein [Cyanobacteriota bacterium]
MPGTEEFVHPRVTLCTVTHKRPSLLALLAECIAAQNYPPDRLEWVIIDDSGPGFEPDLSAARRAGIALRHLRLPERLPLGAKRNLCHENARGELLVIMDDDDYYPPSRVPEAVAVLRTGEGDVAGCRRMPMLLLPEGSRWLTPSFAAHDATANTLAYRRSYPEGGHRFDPEAWQAEEVSFLEGFTTPLLPLDPARTLTCIGHGSNTIDKRLWIARIGAHRFERLPADAPGFPPQHYQHRYLQALGLPVSAADVGETSRCQSPPATAQTPPAWRVAVVTPYHQEPLEMLRRCHASVRAQDVACTHVLVADGPGYGELAGWFCRHIVLGVGHADNGSTPRSIGALAAMNEGYDCIAFLDADNWLAPDHLRRAIATQAAGGFDVVFSGRHIVFPNGLRLTVQPEEERGHRHADTSCMVLFEPAFSSLALWAQMPRLLAPLCDRVVFRQLMARHRCGWTGAPTLFYETWYAGHFLAAGLLPPRNAKFLQLQPAAALDEAAEAFRRRCPLPVYPGDEGVGPDKPRINLVTILGAARCGGTVLQGGLCRYLGFEGIPENQFLHHCVARLGPDPRVRHGGEQLRRVLADPLASDPLLKPHDLALGGLEQGLRSDRSYTLLEAYFRVVVGLTPPETMAFARSYGRVTVLDRSCTLPLVADVLFQCLPEHRAVLVLRDPLAQIASVRRMQARYPEAWGSAATGLETLCRTYLQSLEIPLQAAPPGQLQLVSHGRLVRRRSETIEEVSRWLGLEPNASFALEPLKTDPDHWFNRAPAEAWRLQLEALPGRLLRQEPWKQACMAAALDAPDSEELGSGAAGVLSASEQEALGRLFAPLRCLIQELEGEAIQPPGPGREPWPSQASTGDQELVDQVKRVVEGLGRHRFPAEPR